MPSSKKVKGGGSILSSSNSGNNSQNAPSPSSYSSASSYQLAVNGTPNSQFERVTNDGSQSNTIVGIQGQKAGRGKCKKGGLWSEVISQAVVPFGILAAQQTYRKRRGGKKTRKLRGRKSRKRTRKY